jgi:hypothetical protein
VVEAAVVVLPVALRVLPLLVEALVEQIKILLVFLEPQTQVVVVALVQARISQISQEAEAARVELEL